MTRSWRQWAGPFLAGLLAGGALAVGGARHVRKYFRDGEKREHRMLERFSRKLDLTPEQKAKVGAVLEEKGRRMRSLWDESRPKIDEVRDATRKEIRALLSAAQQEKFDRLEEKMEKRWKRWSGRRGP